MTDRDEEYYEMMLNALAGVEDDLLASSAPEEAVQHVREALRICRADFKRRYPVTTGPEAKER
jgi:hypothetical protein